MFNRKKYKLKFRKSYQYVSWGTLKEVTDSALLNVLAKLQEKYNFEIISTKFKDCFDDSFVKIKCDKKDKNKIFGEFCNELNRKIERVSF